MSALLGIMDRMTSTFNSVKTAVVRSTFPSSSIDNPDVLNDIAKVSNLRYMQLYSSSLFHF